MPKHMPKLRAVLMVAVMAAWMGVLVPPAFAKKEPAPPAPVAQTGQTTSYAAGDDGAVQAGVPFPNPRFSDNGDGTVRDNLTGLIWLKDAGCLGSRPWADALAAIEDLNQGMDFSCVEYRAGTFNDWRLPNVRELQSLIDFAFLVPALSDAAGTGQWTPGNAFSGEVLGGPPMDAIIFWSSTTVALNPTDAWYISLGTGLTNFVDKGSTFHVWPVRGGL